MISNVLHCSSRAGHVELLSRFRNIIERFDFFGCKNDVFNTRIISTNSVWEHPDKIYAKTNYGHNYIVRNGVHLFADDIGDVSRVRCPWTVTE